MPKRRYYTVLIVLGSFIACVAAIIFITQIGLVIPAVGKLMLVSLLGIYIGVGILVAGHKLVSGLD